MCIGVQKPARHYQTLAKLHRIHLNCLQTVSFFKLTHLNVCNIKAFSLNQHMIFFIFLVQFKFIREVQMVGLSDIFLRSVIPAGCDWSHPKMMSPKNKAKKKPPKDSMTLLPCFYFVEVCVDWMN